MGAELQLALAILALPTLFFLALVFTVWGLMKTIEIDTKENE